MKKIDPESWKKKVKVNNKKVSKKKVLDYYSTLWKRKSFRDVLQKDGIFVRADYGSKSIIKRKNISIKKFKDLKKIIHEHGIELITPLKNTKYNSVVDIDMPKKYVDNKKHISQTVVDKLRDEGVKINMVTDAPRGAHIFSKSKKSKVKDALKKIAGSDDKFYVGKSSKKRIVLDPDEPNIAVPGSLSIKGKPYRIWRKTK